MHNLVRAGFHRLRKDNIFWVVTVIVVLATTLMTFQSVGNYLGDQRLGLPVDDMEEDFFNQAPVMGILAAVFVSLFWGTEYSDGTIRNKLCAGHRRSHVYLAQFFVCMTANLIFLVLWFLFSSPMYFLIGPMAMGWTGFLSYAAVTVCYTAALTALFTPVCSAVTNKAYSAVLALGLWLLAQMTAIGIYDRLCEPEITGPYRTLVGNEMVLVESGANPLYVGGSLRTVLEYILEFLPTGQTLLVNDIAVEHPLRGILLSLAFTGLCLFAGIQAFRKKDIR